MKAAAIDIHLPWGTLKGLHWARPGAPKVMCLHGWLDNAASFVPLAPLLEDFDLLAAIRAPVLVITSRSIFEHFGEAMARRRLSAIADCTHVMSQGHHHFHMEDAQQTGHRISEFLLQHDHSQEAHHADR